MVYHLSNCNTYTDGIVYFFRAFGANSSGGIRLRSSSSSVSTWAPTIRQSSRCTSPCDIIVPKFELMLHLRPTRPSHSLIRFQLEIDYLYIYCIWLLWNWYSCRVYIPLLPVIVLNQCIWYEIYNWALPLLHQTIL